MMSLTNSALTYKPMSWDIVCEDRGDSEIELDNFSSEFLNVQQKIRATLSVVVDRVVRIENPFLWGCYLLKKEENQSRLIDCKEVFYFHCTATSNVSSIIKNNLDWRRSTRNKFGQGVSFSPSAKYANQYANKHIGLSRALIVAKLLVGMTCLGHENMLIPSLLCDTSIGNQNNVYVKYYDNEFYPQYVAYYDSPPIVIRRRRFYL